MDIKQIENIVKKTSCSDYIIKEVKEYSTELFVIDGKVDMTRINENTSFSLTLYVDTLLEDNKYRGSASVDIPVTATNEEVEKYASDCALAASYIKDKYYTLPEQLVFMSALAMKETHEERLKQIADALLNVNCKNNEKINSFEVFVTDSDVHMITSSGSDITYQNKENEIEVIVNVGDKEHEIEIYYADTFTMKSTEELTQDIEKQLQYGQDRMVAVPNNVECDNIIFSEKNVLAFGNYYSYQVNVQALYMGAIQTKIGGSIYKDEITGDKVTLKTYRHIPEASNNAPCDAMGLVSEDATIIEDGICRKYVGSHRFGYYLNEACLPLVHSELSGGKYTEAELKKEPYLECIEFSDFQVDPFTGNFAGELRLGYYFDGTNITPVSGGSISGQLKKLEKEIYFSKETKRHDNHIAPKCIMVKKATIAHVG